MAGRDSNRSETLFHAALKLPIDERREFLESTCGDDRELLEEVTALLHYHEATSVLDSQPDPVANENFRTQNSLYVGSTLSTPTSSFRLEGILGEGGMGVVYLAEQTQPLRRPVALKVIRPGTVSPTMVARFESERQAAAMMDHPYIAQVLEAGELPDGTLYFAMERVDGAPIDEYCDANRATVRERLDLFTKVCRAVQHAHQKGIIHRDLKPSNILVQAADGDVVPKIIDFGIAKATNHRLIENTLKTHYGEVVGSLRYMSPEQSDPTMAAIDSRSDIYSLGCVLYELLAGCHPLNLDDSATLTFAEIERRILRVDSQPLCRDGDGIDAIARARDTTPSALHRQLRGDLSWIVAKAMEKDPSRRYATVSELEAELERYLANEPVMAGPPSRRYRARKFVARNRTLVTFVTIVALTLTGGLATSLTLFVKNRKAMRTAQKQRDDILMLSDRNLLEQCILVADSLGPPFPEYLPEMEAWIGGTARELAQRFPQHQERLARLCEQGELVERYVDILPDYRRGEGAERTLVSTYEFSDPGLQFEYDLLSTLVVELAEFTDPDPHVGTLAGITARAQLARSLEDVTINRHAREWAVACESIADTAACPGYQGYVMSPQLGLVPVGRDPATGLWEFYVWATGERPERGAGGELMLTEESGVVLVLIPGGCFWMGVSMEPHDDPGVAEAGRWTETREVPVHRVCLDPFFISKYEVTQAQWSRITGEDPSGSRPGKAWDTNVQNTLHPVENVTWYDGMRAVRSVGLMLPTEAQWEYAARAGTVSPWIHRPDPDCLELIANILDQSALRNGKPPVWNYRSWDDGFVETAPVGRFLANDFGLYDVLGNVAEWTRCPALEYDFPVRPGDGTRVGTSNRSMKRGGDWTGHPEVVRVFRRLNVMRDSFINIGVRPSRAVYP